MNTWHFEEVWRYRQALLNGLLNTLTLNAIVLVVGTLAGCLVAGLRLAKSRVLAFLGRLYVDLFRTLPLLVLLVWLFFALPALPGVQVRLEPFVAAIIALSLNLSAFVAEIGRAGFKSVPAHYLDAARTAGFSRWQTWRFIKAPIALRLMTAPLFGQYINQVKLSVLASMIAVPELLHTVNTITTQTFRPLELYTALAGIFLMILLPCTWLQGRIEERQSRAAATEETDGGAEACPASASISLGDLPFAGRWQTLPETARLSVSNVGFNYNGKPIIHSISFSASPSTVTAIIGSNGSGKTTLIRILSGSLQPSAGQVVVEGVSTEQRKVRIGYLTQEHEPWPHLSVLENIALPLRVVAKLSREQSKKHALEWLSLFRLEAKRFSKPSELSGGQRQRLALATTLSLSPEVLLLDEPTSAMDFRWAIWIERFLRKLAQHGVMILCVSHGLGFLRNTADTIVFIDARSIREMGPAASLLTAPDSKALRDFLEAA